MLKFVILTFFAVLACTSVAMAGPLVCKNAKTGKYIVIDGAQRTVSAGEVDGGKLQTNPLTVEKLRSDARWADSYTVVAHEDVNVMGQVAHMDYRFETYPKDGVASAPIVLTGTVRVFSDDSHWGSVTLPLDMECGRN